MRTGAPLQRPPLCQKYRCRSIELFPNKGPVRGVDQLPALANGEFVTAKLSLYLVCLGIRVADCHILSNGLRNDAFRQNRKLAVHALPIAVLIEVNLCTVA